MSGWPTSSSSDTDSVSVTDTLQVWFVVEVIFVLMIMIVLLEDKPIKLLFSLESKTGMKSLAWREKKSGKIPRERKEGREMTVYDERSRRRRGGGEVGWRKRSLCDCSSNTCLFSEKIIKCGSRLCMMRSMSLIRLCCDTDTCFLILAKEKKRPAKQTINWSVCYWIPLSVWQQQTDFKSLFCLVCCQTLDID